MNRITILFLSLLISLSPSADENWYTPNPDNLVYLTLTSGPVVIELAPFAAPQHVERFKTLVKDGYYDGLPFYRVIEGFVAQAGDTDESADKQPLVPLAAELSMAVTQLSAQPFTSVHTQDLFANQVGYWQQFTAGQDPQQQQRWLLHCPGAVAMARSTELNSATSHFYVVIGQAPRHLDRNMTVFGRVIHGMDNLQSLPRGEREQGGVIDNPSRESMILSARIGDQSHFHNKLNLQVQLFTGPQHQQTLQDSRSRDNPFFHYKGNGNLDICYYPVKVKQG